MIHANATARAASEGSVPFETATMTDMTVMEARSIHLSFEGAYESEHMGHPDFRVANGIFATLWPTQNRSVLRLPRHLADTLAQDKPDTYRVVSRSEGMGWVSVHLPNADVDEFRELARESWQVRSST